MNWLLIAFFALSSSLFAASVDIELDRYPFLISNAQTNQKTKTDSETIHYTRVFRYAPRSEKDLSSYKKTYQRNDLTNNSIIGTYSDYPSWLINDIKEYNKGKESAELIRIFGKAYTFAPSLFTRHFYSGKNGKWYQRSRKARKANGKKGSVLESKLLKSSKHILTHKKYYHRPVFAFNPVEFDTDQEHILKINPKTKLLVQKEDREMIIGPRENSIVMAGKEISFIQTKKDRYKYRLSCNPEYKEDLEGCQEALVNHFNSNSKQSPRTVIDEYINNNVFETIKEACYHCNYEPYFRLIDPDKETLGATDKNVTFVEEAQLLPSQVFSVKNKGASNAYNYYSKSSDVFELIYAVDKEFSFIKNLLESANKFQTMVSRIDGRDIKAINYPSNAFASYHYSREARGASPKSKTMLNAYSACMFQELQKQHLIKIIQSDYFTVQSNFKEKLHSCLQKHHPDVPSHKIKQVKTILRLFSQSNHPCSDIILNTGSALQYGDMGIAYSFETFRPHQSHKHGSCIDTRPMRQTHINREKFLEKINNEIIYVKNKKIIRDVNKFIKRLAIEPHFIEGLRSSEYYLNKKIPYLFRSEKDENGELHKTRKILKYSELPSGMKKFVMGEYINHAITQHKKGDTNPAVSAYFLYSVKAIDSNYDSIKDENTTNDFIRLLKNLGADHDSLAYTEGYGNHGRHSHNDNNYRLGLEITKNWSNHNDHLHFCFDYRKAEDLLDNVLDIVQSLEAKGDFVMKNTVNEALNQGVPDSLAIDYFAGLRNKLECLENIPSKFNNEKKPEIDQLLEKLGIF